MSLFDVEAILLLAVISDIVTNECLYMFTKQITTYYEWLQSCDVRYQKFPWLKWQLNCSLADSGHTFCRPLSASSHVLADLSKIVHGVAELQISLGFC